MSLHLLVLIPLLGAIVLGCMRSASIERARVVSLLFTLSALGVFLTTLGSGAFDGGELVAPSAALGELTSYRLAMDGLSAPFVALTVVLGIIAVLSSWRISDRPAAHHALLLALQAAVTGVFLAQDVILFYVFWEAVLIPMFFLIGVWGHEDRRHAALKFFIYTFAGSALMLIGILLAVYSTGETSMAGVVTGFQAMREYYANSGVALPVSPTLVFWLIMIGLLVKVPAVPVHTWLPDAHVEAPTAGSVMLAGVLLKMGGYGMIRLGIPLAPDVFADARVIFAILGIAGVVYGAIMALSQSDLKRLVAYSSVAHMGFSLIALSTGTLNGQIAAVLIMVSHGVVSALMFFLVGELYDRTHTREIDRFAGMARLMPAWGTVFTFGALASLGLPGLSGFPGEFMAIVEGFNDLGWWMLIVLLGVILGGAYNLRAVFAVGHGPAASEWAGVSDLDGRAILVALVLAVLIVILGVWPRAVIDVATPALSMILKGGA